MGTASTEISQKREFGRTRTVPPNSARYVADADYVAARQTPSASPSAVEPGLQCNWLPLLPARGLAKYRLHQYVLSPWRSLAARVHSAAGGAAVLP